MASLKKTLDQYEIEVSDEAYPLLKQYCTSVWEINKEINLTRHTSYEKFVTRDLVDTIELSKLIPNGSEVLDVGSGGGVPGLVLAIIRPDLNVSLTDSVGKKAAALGAIADQIGISLEIYQSRAEDLLEDFRFDYTVARAVGPLKKFGIWFEKVWPSIGKLLAIKGPKWVDEKAAADEIGCLNQIDIEVVSTYDVPGLDWQSVILQMTGKRDK
ncbi:MAG: 16S rRNA (guanine(527)-N(7))-methyltransferase RsmG [Planctomycetota bacterium]